MSDYAWGLAIIDLWANAAGIKPSALRATLLEKFSRQDIESIGTRGRVLHVGKIEDSFRDAIASGASKQNPSLADFNTALLILSGAGPSVVEAAKDVAKDVVGKLDVAGKLIIVGGLIYILISSGVIVALLRGVKEIKNA